MASKAEQGEATRKALVAEARRLFAEHGYAGVGLAGLVRAAGVTKGALYHHFGSKEGLFREVLRQVQGEVADRVERAADALQDPWDRLSAGCRAFLAAGADPGIRRIMLIDAPAVLGWEEWRAMDEAASARHLADALTELVEAGAIAPRPVEPLAHLLSGAMNEAALWLARSTGPTDEEDAVRELTGLLEGLRTRG
ncbi:TetR/AcrR family transcriptional regulator [Nocardiopsis potens]|uniref:TetR/AcrR family transcriptional regulator n=1 Tax=Nocardiopsis potens TaxID=1246458 RepID=UPI00034585A2|nr:TetR/AcrR family transcriptional regulator [Nocardiopsis potens]